MQVTLVCKKRCDGVTVKKEYPFTFEVRAARNIDGFIVEDDGCKHYITLPSNCHKLSADTWKSSDYFSEVVTDPEQ